MGWIDISIYEHYREEERSFVDQVLTWRDDVKIRHRERLSDFLDPREQEIVKTIIGNDDEIKIAFSGGASFTERRRVKLIPPYIERTDDDFQLALFEIEYPQKFVTLEHRDVLGALMNLGIKREKFGDIVINDGNVQMITAEEIADYIQINLEKVGKATIRLQRITSEQLVKPQEEWTEAMTTVSSLRLDAVLSQIYSMSRTKVIPYIEKGLVKVNWKQIDQTDFTVAVGDYLSMRGFGRARLVELLGQTKKDKIRLRYERLR